MTLKELAASKQLGDWRFSFDERQRKQIAFSVVYDNSFGHGADGHNSMMIIARMASLLDEAFALIEEQAEAKAVP